LMVFASRYPPSAAGRTERLLLIFALMSWGALIFGGAASALGVPSPALAFIFFPLVIWAALRFGQRGNVATIFAISIMAYFATAFGFGPFSFGTIHENLFLLHSFMCIISMTGLFLTASIEERRQAIADREMSEEHLRKSHEALEETIQ